MNGHQCSERLQVTLVNYLEGDMAGANSIHTMFKIVTAVTSVVEVSILYVEIVFRSVRITI